MNTNFLLGIGWPEAATFDIPYALASAVALLVVIWLMAFLKRTADEHYRLLKEEEANAKKNKGAGPDTPHLALAVCLLAGSGFATADEPSPPPPAITVGAFVETYFGWNFNKPENGVTAFRGFDARHDSFALSNAVLDTHWNAGAVSGRLALQTGDTPDMYYGAEAASDIRHILEATVAWKAPVGKGLTLDGGIFLSPIGPASALFFPTTQVRSLTATLDARPADHMSARLEFRHDSADDPIYFKGAVSAPSAKSQSTLTFGLTAWF